MQNVYSAFGVGMEFRKNLAGSAIQKARGDDDVDVVSDGGLGQYALLPEHKVHLTKQNHQGKLDDPTSLSKLLNRFGPFWDTHEKYGGKDGLQKAQVWVEKSPQNIVLSTFLEGIYNMPVTENEDGTVSSNNDDTTQQRNTKNNTVTKFIFMTRHPIANVLATDRFIQDAMGGKRDFEVMLRNYIQMHKYARQDQTNLQSPYLWVKLEDFTTNPMKIMNEIYTFLNVGNDHDLVQSILQSVGTIQSDPNEKYMKKWCLKDRELYKDLIPKYNEEIKALGLGYDLTNVCESEFD